MLPECFDFSVCFYTFWLILTVTVTTHFSEPPLKLEYSFKIICNIHALVSWVTLTYCVSSMVPPTCPSSGSVGNKAQGGQPGSGVYGSSVAPVASQGSGSYSHSAAATTTAPYSTDASTDYSQYNQAYTQVLQHVQTHYTEMKMNKCGDRKMDKWVWTCLVVIVLKGNYGIFQPGPIFPSFAV